MKKRVSTAAVERAVIERLDRAHEEQTDQGKQKLLRIDPGAGDHDRPRGERRRECASVFPSTEIGDLLWDTRPIRHAILTSRAIARW